MHVEFEVKLDIPRDLVMLTGIGLVAAAVRQELQKPPEERTWRGYLAGLIPYDFRPPTVERLREAFWNPDDPRILTERPLGVGWGVNVPAVLRLIGVSLE